MKTWITQLRKGLLEFCLLNAISGVEKYGYKLVQELKDLDQLTVTESTVYPILARLKKDSYIKIRIEASSSGPPRRYFSLTNSGRTRVRDMNIYWDKLCANINQLRKSKNRRNDNGIK